MNDPPRREAKVPLPVALPAAARPTAPYRVRWAVFSNGERFPVLLRTETGLPVFLPTAFTTMHLRGNARAANTIDRCLRALLFLHVFADVEGIELNQRIESGKLLDLWELDRLADAAHRHLRSLVGSVDLVPPPTPRRRSLERVRARPGVAMPSVSLDCTAIRIFYIHQFLDWCTRRRAGELIDSPAALRDYQAARAGFLGRLRAHSPDLSHRESEREGLPVEVLARIPSVIDPGSPDNPWEHPVARLRNQLLIRWLTALGERHGELLSMRLEDVDLGRNEARVIRRPDSADDPRRKQPTVKTDGRPLPLDGLEEETEHYVFDVRPRIPNATTHPFLFVDVRSGRPLSSSGLAKILRQLGVAIGAPGTLTPHVLRHSWNDAFSRDADEAGMSEQDETDTRNFLQGWSQGSTTSRVYTRRHVREAASAALRQMNARLLAKGRAP